MLFFILLLIFTSAAASSKKNQDSFIEGARYRGVQCKVDNKTIELIYCNIKAYSRKISFLNIGLKFVNPLDKPIYVQLVSNYQFGSGYREIINSGKQEWCSIMEETTSNAFLKVALEVVRENPVTKDVFRQCPYTGSINVHNFSTQSLKFYEALPPGFYRLDLYVFKNEKLIFSLKLNEEVKKDSL